MTNSTNLIQMQCDVIRRMQSDDNQLPDDVSLASRVCWWYCDDDDDVVDWHTWAQTDRVCTRDCCTTAPRSDPHNSSPGTREAATTRADRGARCTRVTITIITIICANWTGCDGNRNECKLSVCAQRNWQWHPECCTCTWFTRLADGEKVEFIFRIHKQSIRHRRSPAHEFN